ncbi:hypothetical protein CU098_012875 [Rhizopus stolonifer]|uniref:Uncharacterized protein n=1 Tax=Rhizopus stolonifer TaxID=4846 RepID=A0A367KQM1_RHIST|nr:hypothetical protein CU098_012875 [Rhizopus stolonifer]
MAAAAMIMSVKALDEVEIVPQVESALKDFAVSMTNGDDAISADGLLDHLLSDLGQFIEQILHPSLSFPPIVPTVPIPSLTLPTIMPTTVALPSESFSSLEFTNPFFEKQAKHKKRAVYNLASDLAEPPFYEMSEVNAYSAEDSSVASASDIYSSSIRAVLRARRDMLVSAKASHMSAASMPSAMETGAPKAQLVRRADNDLYDLNDVDASELAAALSSLLESHKSEVNGIRDEIEKYLPTTSINFEELRNSVASKLHEIIPDTAAFDSSLSDLANNLSSALNNA